MLRAILFAALLLAPLPAAAQMTHQRLTEIVIGLDPNAELAGNAMRLTVEDIPVAVVTDEVHDRMRIMVMIRSASGITPEEMLRMMQANFDSALDARYAIARNRLIGVFIHPLGSLDKDQFLSGLGQTVNLALSYGSAYTSGGLTFGGGDSAELHRQLIEKLLKKGEKI